MSNQLLPVLVSPGADTLDEKVDASLAKSEKKVEILAETDGPMNRPGLDEPSLNTYIEPIHHSCQELLDFVEESLGFDQVCQQVLHNRELAQVFTVESTRKLVKLSQESQDVEETLSQLPEPPKKRKTLWVWVAVCILSAIDGIFAISVLEDLIGSLALAIPASLVYAATLAVLAHLVPKSIPLGSTKRQKIAVAIVWTVGMTSLFFWMSSVRETAMHTTLDPTITNTGGSAMTPVAFTLASLLLFAASALLCFLYLPTLQQMQAIRTYDELIRRKEEIQAEKKQLEADLAALPRQLKEMEQTAGQIIHRGRLLEQRIVTAAYRLFALYQSINLRCRHDQGIPASFDKPYPWEFTLKFTSIFNTMYHEQ